MGKIDTVIFSYRVNDILEELTKRTSKLGQMRGTEQQPFLVDRLSLTSGEDFMFSEFLEDAVSETYDWVKAFGRCIPMYDKIVLKYDTVEQYANHGFAFKVNGSYIGNVYKETGCKYSSSSTALLINHAPIEIRKIIGEDAFYELKCNYTIHSVLDGEDVVKKGTVTQSRTMSNGQVEAHTQHSAPFELFEGGKMHDINSVDVEIIITVTPTDVKPIKKGTYVEYHFDVAHPELFDVYQVNYDCTNADWLEHSCKLAVDPRDCVVFILERPLNMDLNMISSIDRNIKEAIVNYIMFKWFEYTNVEEADKFYVKFEYYAQKAQIGMNSEVKVLQRKYNINH